MEKDAIVLEEEMNEIKNFLSKVDESKMKILDKMNKIPNKDHYLVSNEELMKIISENVKLHNTISEDTVKIYIESTFDKRDDWIEITETTMENFLTSILIFSEDEN